MEHAASGDETQAAAEGETKNIFEQHSEALMGQFGATCEATGIEYAVSIAVEPTTGRPMVFVRGDTYRVAQLTKMLLIRLRDQVLDELSV